MMPARRFKISYFALTRFLACLQVVSTSNVQADSQQTSAMDARGWDASIKEVQALASGGKGVVEVEKSVVTPGATGASSSESLIGKQAQVSKIPSERRMRTAAISTQMTVASDGEIVNQVPAKQNQFYHDHKLMRHNRWQILHDRADQVTRRVVSSSGDIESFQPVAEFHIDNDIMTPAVLDLASTPSPVLATAPLVNSVPTIVPLAAQPLAAQPQPVSRPVIPTPTTSQSSGLDLVTCTVVMFIFAFVLAVYTHIMQKNVRALQDDDNGPRLVTFGRIGMWVGRR
jgi:hypothetical protein